MTDAPLVVTDHGATRCLTLSRPDARNALSVALVGALERELAALPAQRDVRAVVLTGAGDRAFCAGADLREREGMDEAQVRTFVGRLQALMTTIEALPQPVIAAINGFALGGGLELALACDLRVAADGAMMGLPEVRLGIIPGAGGTQRLPRAIGHARARELVLTGRRIDAARAEQIGLVHEVAPADGLLTRCLEIADEIAAGAPLAVEQAKHAVHAGMQVDLDAGLAIEREAYQRVIPTEDRLEALAAFREKRAPVFRGR